MRYFALYALTLVVGVLACGNAHAQSLLNTCHASSSYDITIKPNGVLFDRAQTAPRRVFVHDGELTLDGVPVKLDAEDSDRVTLIERTVRKLEPKVKRIADRGVDLAAQAVREQAAEDAPAASGEVDARVASVAGRLKTRIAGSNSSHDWHGPAFRRYANQAVTRVVTPLAAGLLQQAVAVALSGDMDAAARLRQRAANMASSLREGVRRKLQVLRPRVQALCPSLRHLDRLESGIHTPLPGGVRIDLIDVGGDEQGSRSS